MYLMYVDESGDIGLPSSGSSTPYFILSGLVVHELRWASCMNAMIGFRQLMKERFGLRLREEIHSAHMINKPGPLVRIKRNDRLSIIRQFAGFLAGLPDLSVINVLVDKQAKEPGYDVFAQAWQALIEEFETGLSSGHFHGPQTGDDCGLILPDRTDPKKLNQLLRKMRQGTSSSNTHNQEVGSRMLGISKIIEGPHFKDSAESFFIQAADLIAFLLYQKHKPNEYFRRNSAHRYFDRIAPILYKTTAGGAPDGIVRL